MKRREWRVGDYVHVRVDVAPGEKRVWWERLDGTKDLDGHPIEALPLYAADKLADVTPGSRVIVCEGEVATDALLNRGVIAVGTATGAGATPGTDALQVLSDYKVTLWPDNDAPGAQHMGNIAKRLWGMGHRAIDVVKWRDAPEKADAADFDGDDGALDALLAGAWEYKPPPQEPVHGGFGLQVVRVADVEREEVDWLWEGRLARGKLTCLMGDPGVGKSWAILAAATAITRGVPLPGQTAGRDPADVLILSAEDGVGDTLRPRLEDMGADLGRINVVTAWRELDGHDRHLSLLDDLAAIEQEFASGDYRLWIVDPVNSYLGTSLDTHRDAALRGALTPLATLCERQRVACVFTLHLNKSPKERAIYRASGSIAYTAGARVVLLAGQIPDRPTERAVVWVKGNLSPPAPSLGYEISEGRFAWTGETDVTAAAILAPDQKDSERSAIEEAREFLRDLLGAGPVRASEVNEARIAAGISERTLKRARRDLSVERERQGGIGANGFWTLSLPADPPKSARQSIGLVSPVRICQTNGVGTLSATPACAVCGGDLDGFESDGTPKCAAHRWHPSSGPGPRCSRCRAHISVVNTSGLCGRCIKVTG